MKRITKIVYRLLHGKRSRLWKVLLSRNQLVELIVNWKGTTSARRFPVARAVLIVQYYYYYLYLQYYLLCIAVVNNILVWITVVDCDYGTLLILPADSRRAARAAPRWRAGS